jgi:hypothetical protein
MTDDKLKDLAVLIREALSIDSGVSVTGVGMVPEKQLYFPDGQPIEKILTHIQSEFGTLKPEEKNLFVEEYEVVKTRCSEVEIQIGPFKFKIKREPKKIIKNYSSR